MPKTPFIAIYMDKNLAIFLAVRLRFSLRFSALFQLARALHIIRLQNRLHRVRLHRVRQIAYM